MRFRVLSKLNNLLFKRESDIKKYPTKAFPCNNTNKTQYREYKQYIIVYSSLLAGPFKTILCS